MSFTMWQIYYREDQQKEIYSFAVPYYNEWLTIFFENELIRRLVPTTQTEKVAVCSWKLAQKSRRIHPITAEALNSDYDVLSLTRNGRDHKMMAMATHWHPDFLPAITLLWQKLGLKMPGEVKNPIYQNAFSAKTEIYRRYVSEFLSPAMELIASDEELHSIMTKPSGYGRLTSGADLRRVKEKLGMTDYPLCCFVLERCPALFFHLHNISVKYL